MNIEESSQRLISRMKKGTVYMLAIILILSSAYEIYMVYMADYEDEWGFLDETYSAVIKIIMAEFILFDPKKNVLRAIGFYAMSIGLSRVINSLSILSQQSTFSLVTGLILLAMGINLIYSSYNYLKDTTRGRNGMLLSACVLSAMQVITLLLYYQGYRTAGSAPIDDIVPSVIMLVQYIVLLLILDTEEIRYSTLLEKTSTRVESVTSTNMLLKGYAIDRADALVIRHAFDDRSSWSPVSDGGPVEAEKRIRISDGRIKSNMILQKWYGSDKIYVTMVNDDSGTIMLGNRFSVTQIVPETDDDGSFSNIRLFDGGRMLMQIAVSKENDTKAEGASI